MSETESPPDRPDATPAGPATTPAGPATTPEAPGASTAAARPDAPPESADPPPESGPAATPPGPGAFAELGLSAPLLRALDDVGYETPSPIQAAGIPPLVRGEDVLGVAQTGTGKTAAFILPLLMKLDLARAEPQLLVLAPTRELALQVAEATRTYARYLKRFRILPVYGGQGMETQLKQLRRGVHVIVGTPGRVQDHLRRGTLDFSALRAVVLDEADEMLRMGFLEEVTEILDQAPPTRQTALFSATMPPAIQRVASRYLRDPAEVRIKAKTATVATVNQRYWPVRGSSKLEALARILEAEDADGVLIFARTKVATAELAEKLEARGYAADALHGDMSQAMRERTVERFKAEKIDVLVATDVAARGLDVPRISHVINFDIPYDTESYVHRIGRTGRAGRAGEAILFVKYRERRLLYAIEKATRQKIERMELPTPEDIRERRVARFKAEVKDALGEDRLAHYVELVAEIQREQDVGLGELAGALAFMAQGDRPLSLGVTPAEKAPPAAATGGKRGARYDAAWVTFRVSVGRDDGVLPGNLVGAIVNEGALEARDIGRILLTQDVSFLEIRGGLEPDVLEHLRDVVVCGAPLRIRPAKPGEAEAAAAARDRGGPGRGGPRGPGGRGPGPRGGPPRGGARGHRGRKFGPRRGAPYRGKGAYKGGKKGGFKGGPKGPKPAGGPGGGKPPPRRD